MPTRWLVLALLVFPLLLAGSRVAHAAGGKDNCTGYIPDSGLGIFTSGVWCFSKNVDYPGTSGSAIIIQADNVTLDCRGFALDGSGGGAGTLAWGINGGGANITVRNCVIRGFKLGIAIGGGTGGAQLIEDNLLEDNRTIGIFADATGGALTIRRNRVLRTGGGDQPISYFSPGVTGIVTHGSVDVLDNTVSGVNDSYWHNYNTFGIYIGGTAGDVGSIHHNRVRGIQAYNLTVATGIDSEATAGTNQVFLRNNHIVGDGSALSVGISCGSTDGLSHGISACNAYDNVINGFATGMRNSRDVRGNDIAH